jgi:hypothetical protein
VNPRVALIAGGVAALIVVTAGVMRWRSIASTVPIAQHDAATTASPSAAPVLSDPKWVTGTRITVEVLNATKVRGLARRAARALRDQGFDVVSTGTNHDPFDSTQVLDRTGHRDWAVRAAKAMGGATVLVRPDSSRDVDLTVLIGASWRPPSQPFYP